MLLGHQYSQTHGVPFWNTCFVKKAQRGDVLGDDEGGGEVESEADVEEAEAETVPVSHRTRS
eukprot:scaffold265642_cov35-Attheya_sp.AAC.1